MLESLHISNYALIDSLDIEFHKGFNVITGETGAGKSIMLGALSLILGGRADSRVVTDPGAKSVIEAVFTVGATTPCETTAWPLTWSGTTRNVSCAAKWPLPDGRGRLSTIHPSRSASCRLWP